MMYRRAWLYEVVVVSDCSLSSAWWRAFLWEQRIPFGLVLLEHLSLCVVANVPDPCEPTDVEFLGAELGHDDGGGRTIAEAWMSKELRSSNGDAQ